MIKQMMTHATVYVAINELLSEYHKDTGWHINGRIEDFTDLSGVNLANGEDLGFSWSDVEAKIIELDAEYDAQQYQRNRVSGVSGSYAASQGTGSIYPSTGEQFDMLYHELETSGSLTTSGSWFKVITSVKDANPKPE